MFWTLVRGKEQSTIGRRKRKIKHGTYLFVLLRDGRSS
jgi:hypothetical protein